MKKTILVLDHDASVRASLKKLLKAAGYRVLTPRNSAEALECIGSENVQLVVMDVNLGDEDGWETIERMAAMNLSIPTIVVTAEFGQRDRANAAGVEALIEKPMDVPVFLSIVEQILAYDSHRARRRASGDEHDWRCVNRKNEAFRRDLERRLSTPLDMSWFDRVQLVTTTSEN